LGHLGLSRETFTLLTDPSTTGTCYLKITQIDYLHTLLQTDGKPAVIIQGLQPSTKSCYSFLFICHLYWSVDTRSPYVTFFFQNVTEWHVTLCVI